MAWLLLVGCLEKTTGVFIPLSEEYTKGHDDAASDPNAGGTGDGVWPGLEDPRIHVVGTVTSDDATAPVQIDVNIDDPDAANGSGQTRVGALHLDNGPAAFEFYAPMDVTVIHLQAFQDIAGDGPSEEDPFARTDLRLAGKDPEPLLLAMKAGARGQPDGGGAGDPNNPGGDPNNPGGDPNAGGGGGQPSQDPFAGATERITVSGTVTGPSTPIVVDFFKVDPAGQGGRTHLFKIETEGAWSQTFPKGYGQVQIEAFVDPQHDGPTQGDPMVSCTCNPLTIGDIDLGSIALDIKP